MKRLIFLCCFFGLLASTTAQQRPMVKISPVKAVTVQLPAQYQIQKIHAGLEESFYSAKKLSDHLVIIQATTVEPFPVSNLTIFCERAIFHVDIQYEQQINQYFYPLDTNLAILLHAPDTLNTKGTNEAAGRSTDQLVSSKAIIHSPLPKDTLYYYTDRLTLGREFEGGLVYLNNLAGSENQLIASLKVVNTSPVAFESDAINVFLTTEVKRKGLTRIDDDDALLYRPVNEFVDKIAPGEEATFIMAFDFFTLAKNNALKFVLAEGKGRRNVVFEINSRTFYRSVIPF